MLDTKSLCEALDLYSFENPVVELIRHNENMTYHIKDANKQYLLRIHKSVEGFVSDIHDVKINPVDLVRDEIKIILDLKNNTDINLQNPIIGNNSQYVQQLADLTPVTVLEWIQGKTLNIDSITSEVLIELGRTIAKMHRYLSQKREKYLRYANDQSLLPIIARRIGLAEQQKIISKQQAYEIYRTLDVINDRFDQLDCIFNKHISHADLGSSNLILTANGSVTPIDFSLCGYSHYYMDLGGVLELDYRDEMRKYIHRGYLSERDCEINPDYLEVYFALSVLLFIASQFERSVHWDWFDDTIKRWSTSIFEPLAAGRSLPRDW